MLMRAIKAALGVSWRVIKATLGAAFLVWGFVGVIFALYALQDPVRHYGVGDSDIRPAKHPVRHAWLNLGFHVLVTSTGCLLVWSCREVRRMPT